MSNKNNTIGVVDEAQPRTVDNPDVSSVYVDGILDVEINDPNVRIIFFQFREARGERVRHPVLEMIRPLATCGATAAMLQRKLAEQQRKARLRGH